MGGSESEVETFRRLIEDVYPSGIISIVSDTWDFFKVITEYSVELKDKILARTPNALGQAKVVFRPDSGDPVKILTGYDIVGEYPTEDAFFAAWDNRCTSLNDFSAVKIADKYYSAGAYDPGRATYGPELSEPEVKGAVECLWGIFGGTMTDKGFKVLHERVGLIYGDSITLDRADRIMSRLAEKGFASCNCVFGIGLNGPSML
jgi:nicotinamide phosphoribosyltransferase